MTAHTIVILGPALSASAMALATERGIRVVTMKPYEEPEEIRNVLEAEQPDAIIVRMGYLTESAIAASRRLQVIVKHGVGVDTIDVAAATAFGIPVLIAPGANARSVAEHAFALMFAVARAVPYLDRRLRDGHWDKATATGTELLGKTIGVVGLGAIGRMLLSMAAPFQMRMLGYDPFVSSDRSASFGVPELEIVSDLNTLLGESDFVSLHCPLTEQNRGMIGAAQLARMKRSAFIINTARGELIDTTALVHALSSGEIAGAGLDTFFPEPPPPDSPLWRLSNLVATPHIGANTFEARERVGFLAVRQVLDALDGRPPDQNAIVNSAALAMATKRFGRQGNHPD